MRNDKTENAEPGLTISQVIEKLNELKEKHGDLQCFKSYDTFYYIPIMDIEFEIEYLEPNEHRPNVLFPPRIVFNPDGD